MDSTMHVNGGTLAVDVHTNADDLHLVIERRDGGLVRVEPGELAGLVAVLRAAAGELGMAVERGTRGATNLQGRKSDYVP